MQEAIAVFKSNVEAYPKSSNVYDSLGEAYEKNGELSQARIQYERARELAKANHHPNRSVYEQNRDRVTRELSSREF